MANPIFENLSAERAVLGAVLKDPSVFWNHRAHLKPPIFNDRFHAEVMRQVCLLADVGKDFGIPALASRIAPPADNRSVPGYLATLMADQADVGTAGDLIDDLKNLWARREAMAVGERLIKEMSATSDESYEDRLQKAIGRLGAIGETISDDPGGISLAATAAIDEANRALKHGKSNAIPWFLPEARMTINDDLELGWLIGLMMASGEGKTSLALQQAQNSAERGYPVIFLSGDQAPHECVRQMASQRLGIEANDIRRGKINDMEFDRYYEECKRIASLPIDIRKMGQPKTRQIASTVRAWQRRVGRPGLVIIDHVKRIRFDERGANLDVGVNQVTGDLKALMQSTNCSGILLQQRNSKGFARDNPRPMLEDLYGGMGSMENFDAIMAGYVAEKWLRQKLQSAKTNEQKAKFGADLVAAENRAELICLKARFGPDGRSQEILREARFTRFASLIEEQRAMTPELEMEM